MPARIAQSVNETVRVAIEPLVAENATLRKLVQEQAKEIFKLKSQDHQQDSSQARKKLRPLAPAHSSASGNAVTGVTSTTASTPASTPMMTTPAVPLDLAPMMTTPADDHQQPAHDTIPVLKVFESELSIAQMWIEYDEGRGNFPAFREMEKKYGAHWRSSSIKGQWSKRCHLFKFIEKYSPHTSSEQDRRVKCRKVANDLDKIRRAKSGRVTQSGGSFVVQVICTLNKKNKTIDLSDSNVNRICANKWNSIDDLLVLS